MTKYVNNIDITNFTVGGINLGSNPFQEEVQTDDQPTARSLKHSLKMETVKGLKRETLTELVPEPPKQGESIHIISNGKFDYFGFIPLILDWIGKADEMYGSTWTMNRGNVLDLLKFYDEGKIGKLSIAAGNYFVKRESAVAATIIDGLRARGQRFRTWENHAKVILLCNHDKNAYYVCEGSANWTANPRTEQNMIANSKDLYDFHAAWLEEMFQKDKSEGK